MLDLGGVLTREHRRDKVDELMRALGLRCAREDFLRPYYAERLDYDRGAIEAAEYWRRVVAALREAGHGPAGDAGQGGPLGVEAVAGLVRLDLESWLNEDEDMRELVGELSLRVGRLVLLSNIHSDGARYLRGDEGRGWTAPFDELVLSCEHRLLKPERGIYELALRAAGAVPEDCLFVDDNPENVEGARAAGLSSFVFAGAGDFRDRLRAEYELEGRG